MDKQKKFKESIDLIWCISCGMQSFIKDGKTKDGRQRIKCRYCKTGTTVGALRKGQRMFDEEKLIPILRKNPLSLNKAEKYVMGLLIADGCFTQGHTLSYTTKDKELAFLVYDVLQLPNKPREYDRRHHNKGIEYQVRWRYKYSKEYWAQLGLIANKTGNEQWLFYMEDNHFIRGYLDGDGCIFVNDKEARLSFTCASYQFLDNLNKYLNKLLRVSLQKIYAVNKSNSAWGLRYRKKESIIIGSYLYENSDNLRLERKYDKYLEMISK